MPFAAGAQENLTLLAGEVSPLHVFCAGSYIILNFPSPSKEAGAMFDCERVRCQGTLRTRILRRDATSLSLHFENQRDNKSAPS